MMSILILNFKMFTFGPKVVIVTQYSTRQNLVCLNMAIDCFLRWHPSAVLNFRNLKFMTFTGHYGQYM